MSEQEKLRDWRDWHRGLAEVMGLDIVERGVTTEWARRARDRILALEQQLAAATERYDVANAAIDEVAKLKDERIMALERDLDEARARLEELLESIHTKGVGK